MGLALKYIVQTKAGTFHYRRRLPADVVGLVSRREFKKLLGRTEKEALRKYPAVNAECERLIESARAVATKAIKSDAPLTILEVHRLAEARARELASAMVHVGGRAEAAGESREAASLLRDSYVDALPVDAETGQPVGGDPIEGRALGILVSGGLSRPAPTLQDAKRLYIEERVKGRSGETAKLSRVNRVMDFFPAANVPLTRQLAALSREEARAVRDYMLNDRGTSRSTVRRYLNDIRAIMRCGLVETDLSHIVSPFSNLTVQEEATAISQRTSFPDDLLPKMRQRLKDHAGADLLHIWQMLEATGCRLGEIAGLMIADLRLDAATPHLSLVPHPHRRLKNAASIRLVPLIGTALEAAREARKAAGDSPYLFPSYGRDRGADAASAALMPHVRLLTTNSKIVVHSLRHRMDDKLQLAGVEEYDRKLVLGHANPGQGDRYGTAEVRVRVAERCLQAALGIKNVKKGKAP